MIYDGIISKPSLDDLFLMHFNKNHDKSNGQFTSGPGGSVSKSNKKEGSSTGGLDDLKKDKNISFGDVSENQQASEKVTKDDISTIYSLKDKTGEITKIIKNNNDLNDIHSKLENLSKKVKRSKDLSFNYSGYGSSGAQFDGYNESTDVGFTVFINKDGKMIIDLDYWG